MAHILLFYNIAILFILFVSYNIPIFIYFKTKDKFLGRYLLFFLPFILYTASLMLEIYIYINLKVYSYFWIVSLNFFNEMSYIFMMYSIFFFWNYILNITHRKIKNIIFLIVCLLLAGLIPFQASISLNEGTLIFHHKLISNFSTFIFIIILIYFFIVGFKLYKKINNNEIRNIVRSSLFLTLIFFPGMLFDFYQKIANVGIPHIVKQSQFGPRFLIHPIFYCTLSIVCTYFIIKYYFKEYNITLNEIPLDNFVRKYDISTREKEVINLLLNGRSNKEIADNLFISVNTVKTHIKNIYEKLNINSRYELITLIKNS